MKKPPDKKVKKVDKKESPKEKEKLTKYLEALKTYKVNKISLKKVVQDDSVIEGIQKAVSRTHQITIRALQFLKLYILHNYHNKGVIPTVDTKMVNACLKVVCEKPKAGRKPSESTQGQKQELEKFYTEHYEPTLTNKTKPSYEHLNTVLDYQAISIITDYENNIKNHFKDYLNRFVNVMFDKKEKENKIRTEYKDKELQKTQINQFRAELKRIKSDMVELNEDEFKSDKKHHQWILDEKKKIIPDRKIEENNVFYDIQCSPIDYLKALIYMNLEIEKKEAKLFNALPIRTDITPKYIRLDTTSIIHILFSGEKDGHKKEHFLTKGNTIKLKDQIWEYFFKTHLPVFQNKSTRNYRFNYQIETDGVGVSVLLIKTSKFDPEKRNKCRTVKKPKSYREDTYIDEVTDKTQFEGKKLVGIDPGVEDLLYCTNGEVSATEKNGKTKHKITTFRYSQNQRRFETCHKSYRDKILKDKTETIIDGKNVIEWETELSGFNKKTCDMDKYVDYLKEKNRINEVLFDYYEKNLYRKLRWYGFINRQKSEAKMMKRFQDIFGGPEEVVIGFGDWEQKRHMKYKEPTKGIGMRRLFKRHGYQCHLVDEYGTSCHCYHCEGRNEKFREVSDPRPWKDGSREVHGLLKCQTFPCSILWNRDTNGALNILKLMKLAIMGQERPKALSRKKDSESIIPAPSAGKFHFTLRIKRKT